MYIYVYSSLCIYIFVCVNLVLTTNNKKQPLPVAFSPDRALEIIANEDDCRIDIDIDFDFDCFQFFSLDVCLLRV